MREPTSGVVIGRVTQNADPDHVGRVEVEFPWLGEGTPRRWCSVASIMGGGGRGAFFMPEVNDEVLVAFQHGDWDHAYVIGFLWNPVQPPPAEDPRQRVLQSVNGHAVRFLDSTPAGGGRGALIIEDANGNSITMANGQLTIRCLGRLSIEAPAITILGRAVRPGPDPI